ncbi:hypothetical protein [Dyella sp. 2RAB6]|uniref:hypothetical protein n=1 Tax=Dyella sp. 2RAB6 TaxID=3232992 RepID=UPI003F8E4D19
MKRTDLVKAHNDAHTQFTYFMLGAAGASIGYALTKLDGQQSSYWLIPGGVALLLWMISFFSGCMMITWGLKAMKDDWFLASLYEKFEKQAPGYIPLELEALQAKVTSEAKRKTGIAGIFKKIQVWTLYGGVFAFIVWRAVEMFRPHADSRPWCFVPGFSI